ncbi:hypothetical protein BGZ90_006165, partial [Linnemannia elongata]
VRDSWDTRSRSQSPTSSQPRNWTLWDFGSTPWNGRSTTLSFNSWIKCPRVMLLLNMNLLFWNIDTFRI